MKFWLKDTDRVARIEISSIVGVLIFASLVSVVIWRAGANARAYGRTPAIIYDTQNEAEAYAVLASLRLKGRVLIHFGEHMPMRTWSKESGVPMSTQNYLYAAAADNLIRKIYGVIPDDTWETVKAELKRRKSVYKVGKKHITAWIDGTPVSSAPLRRLPVVSEPVVLNFASDYFAHPGVSAQGVFAALRQSNLKYDLVINSLPDRRAPRYKMTVEKIHEFQNFVRQLN